MSNANTTRRVRRDASGQVYERKTKRGTIYGLRFVLPERDADGKPRRVYETLGRSWEGCDRREAEARAERLLARVRLGQYRTREEVARERAERESGRVEVPAFEEFAAEWFERRKVLGGRRGTGLSASGENDLGWRLAHLNGWFGGLRLDEVTEEEVERYATAKRAAPVREGGLGGTSANKTLSTLEAIFDVAVRYRRVERNPVAGYRVPAARYVAPIMSTAAQMEGLLDAAGALDGERRLRQGHGRALLATLLLSGLRHDEVLSLRWRDVNLADGWLKVRQGKTENATRTVDLRERPLLRQELADLKARRGGDRDALIFANSKGNKDGQSNVRRRLPAPAVERANAALEKAEEELIPSGLTVHGLRHTHVSARVALGENIGHIADEVGHADAGFTLTRYRKRIERNEELVRLRALFCGPELIEPPATEATAA